MAVIRISNLRLRAIIGANDWERDHKQDLIINVRIDFDAAKSGASDDLTDTVDYKNITKKIIAEVEDSSYQLLEKLATRLLDIVAAHEGVKAATVRVDKPHALRFADSVSVEVEKSKE
ncbi:MAG: dihydroneopterin aldolase [Candidatus Omnitrophica bacterium]|nr:dihydroneopterin aldolase [Candidatus Omnitrophota bacterium]